jgi:hypothetical protein
MYHKDVESQDAARIVVKLEKFPFIKEGNKPFIDKINGKFVTYGAFKNEFSLIPGDHTFRIEHCRESGWPTHSDINVKIKERGEYTLTFEFLGDDKIKVDLLPCDLDHRVF